MSASYFRYTTTLCMYHMDLSMFPPRVCFPRVKTLALLRCSSDTVACVLLPTVFPSLKEIHYLSGHPGSGAIHRRFSKSVSWIFPDYEYPFYNRMVEAGHGIKSNTLLSSYLSKQVVDDFEIYVPHYTLMKGEEYRSKFIHFMNHQPIGLSDIDPFPSPAWRPISDHAVEHPVHLYIKKQTEDAFMKSILDQ